MGFLLEVPWNCLSPPGWLLGHVCQAAHHSATVKPFVDFHLCNIRFLATLFAFSKNKMSLCLWRAILGRNGAVSGPRQSEGLW